MGRRFEPSVPRALVTRHATVPTLRYVPRTRGRVKIRDLREIRRKKTTYTMPTLGSTIDPEPLL